MALRELSAELCEHLIDFDELSSPADDRSVLSDLPSPLAGSRPCAARALPFHSMSLRTHRRWVI